MSSSDEVIPLSRWRAVLARARRGRRAEALLEEPDAARIVAALPVQELYAIIQEQGLADSHDLVKMATPDQIRGLLDFDLWDRDHLVPERGDPWMDALVDAGPWKLSQVFQGLDAELVALYLGARIQVYDLSLETPPDESEGQYYPTPDRSFLLDVLPDGEDGKRVERVVDWLYRGDLDYARRVIMSVRWEMGAELEEYAYRWRSGRMADLGFAEHFEALEVYRWLDPASVKIDEDTAEEIAHVTLPAVVAHAIGERSFLARALTTVTDPEEIERFEGALITLVNRVMSADSISPSDTTATAPTLDRVAATVSMGLEFLAQNDLARGGRALAGVALVRLFRLGHSLTLKLQRAAATLATRGWVTLVPGALSLLDEPLREQIAALLRRPRPEYARSLDDVTKTETRAFTTLLDLARAAKAIELAASLGPLFEKGLGVEPRRVVELTLAGVSPGPAGITFATLGETLAANAILGRPASLVPVSLGDLQTLRGEHLLADGQLRPSARHLATRALEEKLRERAVAAPDSWSVLLDGWLARLAQSITPLASAAPGAIDAPPGGPLVK